MKIFKSILLILSFGGFAKGYAQLTLALQVPPAGVVQKSQLWNMVLVSGGEERYTVEVNLTLISTMDNNPVMTATGKVIFVDKGAKQLKYTDFLPIRYTYLSSAFAADQRPDGFLPIGSYTACYTVSGWSKAAAGPLIEDCIQLEVQPLSPPILNTPFDQDTISTAYPQFTWLPPAPISLLTDLTYDFVLVKMLPEMTPAQALQQNIPIYNQAHLRQPFLNFPATTTALDTGIVYAWGVVAKNAGQFVAVSDAWTFKYVRNQFAKENSEASYVHVKREEDGIPVAITDTLKFIYTNQGNDSLADFTITSLSAAENNVLTKGSLPVQHGDNFIKLPLKYAWKLNEKEIYLLTISGNLTEKRVLKFIIK